jgi:hypothetical protein
MSKRLVKGRRSVVVLATAVAAVTAAGAAYASIPDTSTRMISSCYNTTSGAVRVIDDPSGGYTPTCPSTEKPLVWNQIGRTGPTGMRGPQGPAGPSNLHWVKVNSSGIMTGASDTGVAMYTGPAYAYFSIPNVDASKCAINVQTAGVLFTDGPIATSYQMYGSYVYARAQQLHPNGTVDYNPRVGLDITLAC